MSVVSMKQLLEGGVHFGHQTRRWNPKMAPYIFTERNGIYIIDLQKTMRKIETAYRFINEISARGGTVLFVGTKKQAQDSIREEAERCGMFYAVSYTHLDVYKRQELRVGRKTCDGQFLDFTVMPHARHALFFVESDNETDTPCRREIGIIFQCFHRVQRRKTGTFIVVDAARRHLVTFDKELERVAVPSAPGRYDVEVADSRDHLIAFTNLGVPGNVADVNCFKPHTDRYIEKDFKHTF